MVLGEISNITVPSVEVNWTVSASVFAAVTIPSESTGSISIDATVTEPSGLARRLDVYNVFWRYPSPTLTRGSAKVAQQIVVPGPTGNSSTQADLPRLQVWSPWLS